MDEFDRKILSVLQSNAGLSNVELADRIGLSPAPCLRRVKALEDAGVIESYNARLSSRALGLGVVAFVEIHLERHTDGVTDKFLAAVKKVPEVVRCYLVTGTLDFLMEVVAKDLDSYADFAVNRLLKLPGVKDVRSSFVLKEVKETNLLPLDHISISR